MKKTFLIFGMCAAMMACTESPKEEGTTNTEEHSHDGTSHEHAAPAEDEALTMEGRTMTPEDARVFFVNVEDGSTLKSPIHIEMGVEGMEVEPAGAVKEGFGHHHIIVNNTNGYVERGEVVPMNETNIHFGKGQLEYDLELEPGEYILTLQFANGYHESYGEKLSRTINVNVAAAE